jgi:hypothetical protein
MACLRRAGNFFPLRQWCKKLMEATKSCGLFFRPRQVPSSFLFFAGKFLHPVVQKSSFILQRTVGVVYCARCLAASNADGWTHAWVEESFWCAVASSNSVV